jgi:hypothetical protein
LFALTILHQMTHQAAKSAAEFERALVIRVHPEMVFPTGVRPANPEELLGHPVHYLTEMISTLRMWRGATAAHDISGDQSQSEFDLALSKMGPHSTLG